MSFTITLQDENGEVIDEVFDNGLLFHYVSHMDDKSSYCLRFVDPWGDTVFNGQQMDEFIREMLELKNNTREPDVIGLIDKILNMALKCKNEVHEYIKFWGD